MWRGRFPMNALPGILNFAMDMHVSLQRISRYLLCGELTCQLAEEGTTMEPDINLI